MKSICVVAVYVYSLCWCYCRADPVHMCVCAFVGHSTK